MSKTYYDDGGGPRLGDILQKALDAKEKTRRSVDDCLPLHDNYSRAVVTHVPVERDIVYYILCVNRAGNKIAAIKLARRLIPGIGLKEAKDFVEEMIATYDDW